MVGQKYGAVRCSLLLDNGRTFSTTATISFSNGDDMAGDDVDGTSEDATATM